MRTSSLLLGLGLLVSLTLNVQAEEWPHWRGPKGDGISRETKLLAKWPDAGLTKVWSDKVGIAYSSPVAVEGKVYVFQLVDNKDTLTAYDAKSGKVLWNQSYDGGWTGHYPGTRATPWIEGERIYTYGGAGDLVARKLADGSLIWRTNILKETNAKNLQWGTSSSPLIVGDVIYVQGGKEGPIAVAVDKKDGKIMWQAETKATSSYAAPMMIEVGGKQQLLIFAGLGICGLDPANGKTLWQEEFKTSYDVNAAQPIYKDGHIFVTSGYGHGCMMLQLTADGVKKVWENKNIKDKFPAPVLDNDLLFGNDAGTLRAMKWPTGEIAWSADDKSMNLGEGGTFVRYGEHLITLSEKGRLTLAKATPAGFEKISQFDAVAKGKEIWATPLVYQGNIYIVGSGQIICYKISE